MSQPYVGEIRIFAGNFAPAGWAFCDGTLLPISENDTLFNLIGTTYGGDGQSTFALPDLRGRVPVHQGNGMVMSQNGGTEQVTVLTQQMPQHNHLMQASTSSQIASPSNSFIASALTGLTGYSMHVFSSTTTPNTNLTGSSIGQTGGNLPHENRQPYLGLNLILSLYGIYPSPT